MTGEKTPQRKREALTPAVVERIVLLIDRWKPDWGPISASALERKVKAQLKTSCTRQGMLKKDLIADALNRRLDEARSGKPLRKLVPGDVALLQQRIAALEKRNEEKEIELERHRELIARFRHNARNLGILIDRLEQPLVPLVVPDEAKSNFGRKAKIG